MTLQAYLKLVEIQTKTASIIPYIIGIAYTYYRYNDLKPLNLIIFFISLISIDMATTTINNFMDYKRAYKKHGYNYEEHNAIVSHKLSDFQVMTTIAILLIITVVMGIWLVFRTDIVILLIGMVSFGIGILYSFGPLPISRTPLGELVSGIMMGGFIFFVTVYSQVFDHGYIIFSLNHWVFNFQVNLKEIIAIAFVCAPLILMIGGIMLANNICDIKDDIENQRYTLPFFIGKRFALIVFALIYLGSYILLILSIAFGFLPLISALTLLTAIPVYKGVQTFFKEQKKETTFVISVKNFMLYGIIYFFSLLLHIIVNSVVGVL